MKTLEKTARGSSSGGASRKVVVPFSSSCLPRLARGEIEETVDLLAGEWHLLPDDDFQAERESLGNGQDRLTIILPKAAGKQRFLHLSPQR